MIELVWQFWAKRNNCVLKNVLNSSNNASTLGQTTSSTSWIYLESIPPQTLLPNNQIITITAMVIPCGAGSHQPHGAIFAHTPHITPQSTFNSTHIYILHITYYTLHNPPHPPIPNPHLSTHQRNIVYRYQYLPNFLYTHLPYIDHNHVQ